MTRKLIDYMWEHDENKVLKVVRAGYIVAVYDGRDSIPEEFNNCELLALENDGANCIWAYIA